MKTRKRAAFCPVCGAGVRYVSVERYARLLRRTTAHIVVPKHAYRDHAEAFWCPAAQQRVSCWSQKDLTFASLQKNARNYGYRLERSAGEYVLSHNKPPLRFYADTLEQANAALIAAVKGDQEFFTTNQRTEHSCTITR